MEDVAAAATAVARQTLAAELGCEPEALGVVDVEPVEWSDSALGCPQPGMMYMQVITPGFRVTLEQAGQRYVLHTDGGRRAVHCPQPAAGHMPFSL